MCEEAPLKTKQLQQQQQVQKKKRNTQSHTYVLTRAHHTKNKMCNSPELLRTASCLVKMYLMLVGFMFFCRVICVCVEKNVRQNVLRATLSFSVHPPLCSICPCIMVFLSFSLVCVCVCLIFVLSSFVFNFFLL